MSGAIEINGGFENWSATRAVNPARDFQTSRVPVSRDIERSEMERETGFEPATSTLARSRSTK